MELQTVKMIASRGFEPLKPCDTPDHESGGMTKLPHDAENSKPRPREPQVGLWSAVAVYPHEMGNGMPKK